MNSMKLQLATALAAAALQLFMFQSAHAITLAPGDPTLYQSQHPTHFGAPGDPFDTEMLALSLHSDSPSIVHSGGATFAVDSFFDIFVDLAPGPARVDSFFDIFVEFDRLPAPVDSFFDVFFDVFIDVDPTGVKHVQLLDISTGEAPLTADGSWKLRESPSRPSHGNGSGKRLAGGEVVVDSFFDIFFELSIDGGNHWIEAQGPVNMRLVDVPEPTTALLLLAGLLGLTTGGLRRHSPSVQVRRGRR